MNGPLFQWGGGPGVQTKLPFVYHHILSGSGRALPGWAKGPARKPGGSTGRKSTAIFCRVRPQPVCKSSPPAVSATSSVELQSAAWGGGELRDPKGSQEQRLFCQVQPCRPIGSKPAGPKATPVASLRCGRLRPARLCEPQKHSTHSSHNFLNFGLSPTPPSGFAAGRQGRRP